MAITALQAFNILRECKVNMHQDFHALRSDRVFALADAAARLKYREPKNANGSRTRYFHAMLIRKAQRLIDSNAPSSLDRAIAEQAAYYGTTPEKLDKAMSDLADAQELIEEDD